MNPKTDHQEHWVVLILFITIAAVYLGFPTKNYYWDGIAFAQTIEDAARIDPSLLHPNHLIYSLVGYIFFHFIRFLGIDIRAVLALQILNALLGALCAVVLFQVLRRVLRSTYLSLSLTLLFAFSATWWKFATDADSYIASVLFLLISFYLLLPRRKARPLLIALAFSLSMLFHQLAVFFYPVIVVGLCLQSRESPQKHCLLNPLFFTLAAFGITFTAYCYSYYLITGTFDFGRFMHWITSFSPDVSFSFDARSNFFYSLRGHGRLFFGGRFNAIKELMNPLIVALMICLAVALLVFLYKLVRNVAKPDLEWLKSLKRDRGLRSVLLLSTLWAAGYLIFLFVWLPHNTFYRLFYVPALILIVGVILAARERAQPRARTYRLALLVVIISLCNFLFLIFPSTHTQSYPPLAIALAMHQAWPNGTVIYYGAKNADNSLVRYFNPGTSWRELPPDTAEFDSDLRDVYARGGTAWLETSAIDQLSARPVGEEWMKQHSQEETRHSFVNKAYNLRFVQVIPVEQ